MIADVANNLNRWDGSTYHMVFGKVTLDVRQGGWSVGYRRVVRGSRGGLKTIGVALERTPKEDRKKMMRMLTDKDVTPDQLNELLKKK